MVENKIIKDNVELKLKITILYDMKKNSLQLINEALREYNKRYNTSFNLLP